MSEITIETIKCRLDKGTSQVLITDGFTRDEIYFLLASIKKAQEEIDQKEVERGQFSRELIEERMKVVELKGEIERLKEELKSLYVTLSKGTYISGG